MPANLSGDRLLGGRVAQAATDIPEVFKEGQACGRGTPVRLGEHCRPLLDGGPHRRPAKPAAAAAPPPRVSSATALATGVGATLAGAAGATAAPSLVAALGRAARRPGASHRSAPPPACRLRTCPVPFCFYSLTRVQLVLLGFRYSPKKGWVFFGPGSLSVGL